MNEKDLKKIKKKPMRGGPGGHGPAGAGEKAKDFKGTLNKLMKRYLGDYKWKLIIVFIFAIAGTIFTIVGPKILAKSTTEIYT